MLMAMEVIDGWSLSLKCVMHKTKALKITIGSHWSKIVFNVISSPINHIIIGFFWFILHNLQMDWIWNAKGRNIKIQGFAHRLFGENQDYHLGALEDDPKPDTCIQNLACDKKPKSAQRPRHSKLLFMGRCDFM